jgi:hypothetical protein
VLGEKACCSATLRQTSQQTNKHFSEYTKHKTHKTEIQKKKCVVKEVLLNFEGMELYHKEIVINVTHGQWILLFQVQTAVMWPTALLSLWDQIQRYKGTQSYSYWKTAKCSGNSQINH